MSHAHKPDFVQPREFKFSTENMKKAEAHIAKYPKGKQASAVMPLLDLAQIQSGGWIPEAAMEEIGRILGMPRIKVFEVATFYTMYNLQPKGKHHLQFCTTTPCWLSGSAEVAGACVNAPVVQHNGDDLYEDLTPENVVRVLDELKSGKKPRHGSQMGRTTSMGIRGATCLHELAEKCGVKNVKR